MFDRVAQMVVKLHLESILEPIFHKDSYGYRPRKSAHQAIGVTRKRCWQYAWVVEFDIKGAFDNIDHDLLMRALTKHCSDKWVILYIDRWLKAPMQNRNGDIKVRLKGTPQGGVISPLLANLFFHYVFDTWVVRKLPDVPFCRYADDGLLHCKSLRQAEFILSVLKDRFVECNLEAHPEKSKIAYCKDTHRKGVYENTSFDFLGYTFRGRRSCDKYGRVWTNFGPAVSSQSLKEMRQTIRRWKIQLKSDKSLVDLSRMFNPTLRGWKNYYCQFYSSVMYRVWDHMNQYLIRWLIRKSKKYRGHKRRAKYMSGKLGQQNSRLFVHWQLGAIPSTG